MKVCPNCDGSMMRDWAGDRIGPHPCRMCCGRGQILEPSDVAWLAKGWPGKSGYWHARCEDGGVDAVSLQELMVLIAGAAAIPGKLSKAALAEKGMAAAWRGVIIHPRERDAGDAA